MPKTHIRFDRPRWRWPIAIALGVLVGLVTIVVIVMHRPAASEAEVARAASVAVPTVAVHRPESPPARKTTAPADATPPPCADDFNDWENLDVRRRHLESAAGVVDRHVATLMARGDDMSVAVAQLILMTTADESPPATGADIARQHLARIAVTTTDPHVYMLALNMCRGRADGSCQTVTGEQWARIDPSNAMAWLHVFHDARERGDMGVADAALRRAAEATHAEVGTWTFYDKLFSAMPPKPDAAMLDGTAQVARLMMGVQAAWSHRGLAEASQYCRAVPSGASQRDACVGLAQVLANHSRDFLHRLVGIGLVRKLGGSDAQADKRREEVRALHMFSIEDTLASAQTGCASRERYIDKTRDLARFGELGAAERRLSASGMTLDELVERGRRRQEADARTPPMLQAASSASR